jgi:hypothetical protein
MATQNRFIAKNGLDNSGKTLINVADPVSAQDVATKNFAINASNLTTGTLAAARLPALSGDATSSAGSAVLTLSNSGVTPGNYGTATSVPSLTVDSKGRVTDVTLNAITATDIGAIPLTQKGVANGVATLDANGLIPEAMLPSYFDEVVEYADFASLPVTGAPATIYVTLDDNLFYTWNGSSYVTMNASETAAATKLSTARQISTTGDATWSVNFDGSEDVSAAITLANTGVAANTYGSSIIVPVLTVDSKGRATAVVDTAIRSASTSQTGVVQLSDSTSSTSTTLAATASAVKSTYDLANAAIPASQKGAINGVATLDSNGVVSANQLPSYVDDVIEANNFAALPGTGETGKIYITVDDNKFFRWSGSVYIDISPTSGNSDTATKLATARTISLFGMVSGSVEFDGSENATIVTTIEDGSHNHTIAEVTGLQTALNAKAPLDSPPLTGTPTTPTASVGTNTTQVASTAYVVARIANDAPTKAGVGATGTWGIGITGNAATATKLATARTINGASFDGSANITITDGSALTSLNATQLTTGTIPDARISGSYTGMTNLTGSGTVDFAYFAGNAADTVALPSYTWTGDTNTGIYQPAADQIAFTCGGTQRLLLNSSGLTGVGTGLTALNASNLTTGTVPDARLSGTYTGVSIDGNAGTATALQTARTINGVSFNGTANIVVADDTKLALAGGTLTGHAIFNDNVYIRMGTGADALDMFCNGSNAYIDLKSAGAGSLFIRDTSTTRFTFARATGDFTATGNITAYSDIRIKTNIEVIDNALAKVRSLRGVTYDRIDVECGRHTGLIAQEVQKVLPEAITVNEDEDQTLSVAYGNMIGLMVESVKEVDDKVETQVSEIRELTDMVKTLIAKVEQQSAEIAELKARQ